MESHEESASIFTVTIIDARIQCKKVVGKSALTTHYIEGYDMSKNKQHPVKWQNVKEIKSRLEYSQWLEKFGKQTEEGETIEDQKVE
jgi:hypothetical protein